jgi:hypothetical protein
MTVFGPMEAILPILIYTPEQAAEEYYVCAAANKELSCWCHAGVVASPAGILRERLNCLLAKPANVDRSAGPKERLTTAKSWAKWTSSLSISPG